MSAGSGILPNQATLDTVDELRKNNSKHAFGLFKVEGTTVVPDSTHPTASADDFENKTWASFIKALESAKGPRFGVVDFAYTSNDGRPTKALIAVSWCPDKGVTAKEKMTFASTRTAFEAKINIGKKYSANDVSDLEYKTVKDTISQGK